MPGIPGQDLAGVLTANDFLERVNRPRATDLPMARTVAVVGGGNVAMDAARSALRMGAETVTIVYRRGQAQLPACSGELHEAEVEGVQFVFLASPLRSRATRMAVSERFAARMRLGDADASGRPQAVPTGEEFEIDADQVILALGSRVEPWLAEAEPSLAVDGSARPIVDGDRATSVRGVYAGGDLVRGSSTVVKAIGDGLRAAEAIDLELASH